MSQARRSTAGTSYSLTLRWASSPDSSTSLAPRVGRPVTAELFGKLYDDEMALLADGGHSPTPVRFSRRCSHPLSSMTS